MVHTMIIANLEFGVFTVVRQRLYPDPSEWSNIEDLTTAMHMITPQCIRAN